MRRHPIAGLIVKDLFRGVEVWLVDEGLESSLPDAAALATRLFTPEGFAMTAGVLVPLDSELIENAVANTPQLLHKRPDEVIDDRRFAEAIYRAALARGIMPINDQTADIKRGRRRAKTRRTREHQHELIISNASAAFT